jgi:hypothetical protein
MLTGIVIIHEYGTNVVNILKNGNGCLGAKDEQEIISGFLSAIMEFFNRSLGNIVEIRTESHRLHLERCGKYMLIIIFEDFDCYRKKQQDAEAVLYPAFYHAYVFDTKWKIIKTFRKFIENFEDSQDPYKINFEPLKAEFTKMLSLSEEDLVSPQEIELKVSVVEHGLEEIHK